MNKKDLKFTFFGTGDVATKVLEKLIENGYIPSLVITAPDRPKGRKLVMTPPPIKTRIMNYELGVRGKIQILQPEKINDNFICKLKAESCELFIVADYGKILPKEIVEMPKNGTINVHPSLLPKFRGASPIQSFILSGEEKTGTTIMLMDEGMDHGPILESRELEVESRNLKHKELEAELATLGGEILIEIIPNWIDGKIKAKEQNHDKATYTKKMSKNDGLIELSEPAEAIERKVRALTPWPGVYFFTEKNGKQMRVIITDAEIQNNKLIIKKVKPEGKNEMPLEDFLRGNPEAGEQIRKI